MVENINSMLYDLFTDDYKVLIYIPFLNIMYICKVIANYDIERSHISKSLRNSGILEEMTEEWKKYINVYQLN